MKKKHLHTKDIDNEVYDGPQCPKQEMVCDTIDKDLHKLIDKEFESKKVVDLLMLALILVLILFLLM